MTSISSLFRSGSPSMGEVSRTDPLQGRCGMAASLIVGAGLLLAGLSSPAAAQSSQGLFWNCGTSGGQPTYCPVNNTYPLPVGPTVNALNPVAGTQRGTSIASSTGMTIPTGATVALVQFQGTNNAGGVCAFWQDDGTAPTASAGIAAPAYLPPIWIKASAAFKAIAATGATCTMTVSYYK